jgi:hypothetical protein
MPRCSYCNSLIVVGGVRDGDLRFCNQKCRQGGALLASAQLVPEDVVSKRVTAINQGSCPQCKGVGPVDVHLSHTVWSALVITRWKSSARLSCVSCAKKAKITSSLGSFFLGWWGFPWGLILTPIQITKNLWGVFTTHPSHSASAQLEKIVRLSLAADLRRAQAAGGTPPPLRNP